MSDVEDAIDVSLDANPTEIDDIPDANPDDCVADTALGLGGDDKPQEDNGTVSDAQSSDHGGWESEVSDDKMKGIIKSLAREKDDEDLVPQKSDPRCRCVIDCRVEINKSVQQNQVPSARVRATIDDARCWTYGRGAHEACAALLVGAISFAQTQYDV